MKKIGGRAWKGNFSCFTFLVVKLWWGIPHWRNLSFAKNIVKDISPTMCISTKLQAFVLLIQQPCTQPSAFVFLICVWVAMVSRSRMSTWTVSLEFGLHNHTLISCDILCWLSFWMMWILMICKMHLTLRISPLWMSRVDLWSAQFAGECCRFSSYDINIWNFSWRAQCYWTWFYKCMLLLMLLACYCL